MNRTCATLLVSLSIATSLLACGTTTGGEPAVVWQMIREFPAPEAHQAVAADERFVYAVTNRLVAKYDRATGKRLATSTGDAEHLNSAFLWQGKLYCANSNYPQKPDRSDIKVLDPDTMELSTWHDFGESEGSLTWAVRHDGHWWCFFAFYRDENDRSYLARFDDAWQELARWTCPPELLQLLGRYSLSGGIWHAGNLLVTDHDNQVLYHVDVPDGGGQLELLDKQPAPFTGQGIAPDPATGGLVGLNRRTHHIIFAEPAARRSGTPVPDTANDSP